MRIKDYLKDNIRIFITYLTNMVFINLIIYLDVLSVSKSNILYLNFISFTIFAIYVTLDYLNYRKIVIELNNRIEKELYDPCNISDNKNSIINIYNKYYSNFYKHIYNKIYDLTQNKEFFSDYISSWVHSVKTPISAAKLIIENDEESNSNTLNKIEEELEEILHYTEQALYYSRLDSFSKDYLISEYNLKKIVHKSIKRYSKIFLSKKISVNIDINNITVLTDNKWLTFIVNQIIYNSLKYTGRGGKIEITAKNLQDFIFLKIKDNGCGIKEEDIKRVYDRGFTGYNGRKNEYSTGMGLYLTKKLCEQLGHNIEIESKYNEYTLVYIFFNKAGHYNDITKIK